MGKQRPRRPFNMYEWCRVNHLEYRPPTIKMISLKALRKRTLPYAEPRRLLGSMQRVGSIRGHGSSDLKNMTLQTRCGAYYLLYGICGLRRIVQRRRHLNSLRYTQWKLIASGIVPNIKLFYEQTLGSRLSSRRGQV